MVEAAVRALLAVHVRRHEQLLHPRRQPGSARRAVDDRVELGRKAVEVVDRARERRIKKINDTYGHEAGDVILKTFAKILEKQTREYDAICRYGGEEFVVIVHFKLKRELLGYLKRVKTIVTENKFVYKDERIHITFSAGVATRSRYKHYDDAIKKADELLYEAKNSGRNKIVLDDGKVI